MGFDHEVEESLTLNFLHLAFVSGARIVVSIITGSGHNDMDEPGSGKLAVIKVLGNGKRRFDPVTKARLIDACLEPGVSVAGLALEHGVNANLLRNWIALRRREAKKERPVTQANRRQPLFQ